MFKRKINLPLTIAILVVVFFGVTVWKARSNRLPAGLPAKPILEVANQTIDLGFFPVGKRVDVSFPIANSGGKRIQIHEVDRDCGCGETIRRSMTLAPGTRSDWIVSFDPAFAVGHMERTTCFITSDPALPRFELKVIANVKPPSSMIEASEFDQEVASVLVDDLQTSTQ